MRESGLPPIHPGAFLAEILAELRLSQADLAHAIDVSPMRVSHVVNGGRPVTAELALRLGKALGQSPEYWLNLQSAYDLRTAEKQVGEEIEQLPRRPITIADFAPTHKAAEKDIVDAVAAATRRAAEKAAKPPAPAKKRYLKAKEPAAKRPAPAKKRA